MKIAISIPENVFQDVKKIAEGQRRSRSEVIVEAVRAYLERLESRRMLQILDETYALPDTPEDTEARKLELELYGRTVLEKEEW